MCEVYGFLFISVQEKKGSVCDYLKKNISPAQKYLGE